jgi:hypothetical protein
LRQRPDRDAFRAGRNLPDKEFRYLRTVIVTAAVHRGFPSRLSTPPVNLPALGRHQPVYVGSSPSHRPVFLVNSRLGLVTAAGSLRHPFSRSYGVNLPSSLTRVLPSTLVSSTSPPVSVCGTGTAALARGFSWHPGSRPLAGDVSPPRTPASDPGRGFPACPPARLDGSRRRANLSASPHRSNARSVVLEC